MWRDRTWGCGEEGGGSWGAWWLCDGGVTPGRSLRTLLGLLTVGEREKGLCRPLYIATAR